MALAEVCNAAHDPQNRIPWIAKEIYANDSTRYIGDLLGVALFSVATQEQNFHLFKYAQWSMVTHYGFTAFRSSLDMFRERSCGPIYYGGEIQSPLEPSSTHLLCPISDEKKFTVKFFFFVS